MRITNGEVYSEYPVTTISNNDSRHGHSGCVEGAVECDLHVGEGRRWQVDCQLLNSKTMEVSFYEQPNPSPNTINRLPIKLEIVNIHVGKIHWIDA